MKFCFLFWELLIFASCMITSSFCIALSDKRVVTTNLFTMNNWNLQHKEMTFKPLPFRKLIIMYMKIPLRWELNAEKI